MIICVDVDGTLDSFPEFFKEFFEAMQAKGNKVGILTGRLESEKEPMIKILKKVGINPDFFVAMPDEMKEKQFSQGIYKATVCNDLKADVLFDDFLSDDPVMLADFFSVNQKTIPFTSFAYSASE